MKTFIAYLALMILSVVFYQFYTFTVSRKKKEKQDKCQALGIFYFTIGTFLLVYRNVATAIAGLFLIMLGLRLIAHGLDRIDKKIFIDRYSDNENEK